MRALRFLVFFDMRSQSSGWHTSARGIRLRLLSPASAISGIDIPIRVGLGADVNQALVEPQCTLG